MADAEIDISNILDVLDSAIVRQDRPCQQIVGELQRCIESGDVIALLERLAARLTDIKNTADLTPAPNTTASGRKRMKLRL